MQLARTVYLDNGKRLERKIREMFIAAELEKMYSKNKIMEFYLNNIYFANGYYGMGTPAGADNTWIRTSSQGFIPYASAARYSGNCSLGTSTWHFKNPVFMRLQSA